MNLTKWLLGWFDKYRKFLSAILIIFQYIKRSWLYINTYISKLNNIGVPSKWHQYQWSIRYRIWGFMILILITENKLKQRYTQKDVVAYSQNSPIITKGFLDVTLSFEYIHLAINFTTRRIQHKCYVFATNLIGPCSLECSKWILNSAIAKRKMDNCVLWIFIYYVLVITFLNLRKCKKT